MIRVIQSIKSEITPLEVKLIYYFSLNPNRVISRDELISNVWQRKLPRNNRVVDVAISKLRSKLDRVQVRLITAYGKGYRWLPNNEYTFVMDELSRTPIRRSCCKECPDGFRAPNEVEIETARDWLLMKIKEVTPLAGAIVLAARSLDYSVTRTLDGKFNIRRPHLLALAKTVLS